MIPLYIFDLDGTLALIEHRRHLVEGKRQNWKAFFAACVDDGPNKPVIDTLWNLRDAGCEVRIFSGRSDEVRQQTEEWLRKHVHFTQEDCEFLLTMRREGDYTPDDRLKRMWYDALPAEDRQRLVAVFDDRQKVVDMWRSIGVACFQVAPGDF